MESEITFSCILLNIYHVYKFRQYNKVFYLGGKLFLRKQAKLIWASCKLDVIVDQANQNKIMSMVSYEESRSNI